MRRERGLIVWVRMPGPIDSLRFVHTAILAESARLERATESATSAEELRGLEADAAWFDELVNYHTRGEELGLFPLLAEKAPHIDDPYLFDHDSERRLLTGLREAIASGDLAAARRCALLLNEHTSTHIEKENTLILPFVADTFSVPEQVAIVQTILSTIPPDKMAVAVPWIIERLPMDQAETYARALASAMPPPVFAKARGWIQSGVSSEIWADLSSRVPELAG